MPAYDRCVHEFILDFRRPTINRPQIVNGDTANTFVITLKDKGKAVTLDADLHKVVAVFTRADGQIYAQDAGTGVAFTTDGVVTIDVYSSSFRTGVNNVKIQLYKRANAGDTTYPLLLTTYEQQFQGRSQAIPDSGAENAPSQLPMLEQLISDAQDAIDDCEDATQAANTAAGEANDAAYDARVVTAQMTHMLNNIDDEPTQSSNHLVKSGGVYTALAGKQNTLTFDDSPTSGSNNPVKSGGIKTAIDAAEASASKKNVYLVKHAASTWQTSGSGVMTYEASTLDTAAELEAIEADSILATQVPSPDGASVVTLYEFLHDVDVIYLRSEIIDHSYTIRAAIDISVDAPEIECIKRIDETPLLLHVEDITQSGGYNVVTFSFGEPALIYDGRYTRDMHILLQVIGDADFASCAVLRKTVVKEQDQNSGHITSVSFESVGGNHTLNITAYYRDGVYQTAVYTIT